MDAKDNIVQILQKLETGTCTPQELERLHAWFDAGGEPSTLVSGDATLQLQEEILHAIHQQMEPGATLEEPLPKVVAIKKWWWAAAAVLAGGLLMGAYFYLNNWKQEGRMIIVEVAAGEQQEILLPDSTKVWLNAGARLEYPEKFGDSRKVSLSGQGFFEVKQDASKPFEVKTMELNVLVLGTSFDIKAYPTLDEAQVTVKTGAVKVLHQQEGLDVLNAGDQLIFSRAAQQFMKTKVDDQQINEWASGMISLSQAGFAELALTLENQYGVRIRYNPAEMKKDEYTLRCSKQLSVRQVLDIINSIHPIQYDIQGSDITIHRKNY